MSTKAYKLPRLTFREDDEVHPGHGGWIGRWAEVPIGADGVTGSSRLPSQGELCFWESGLE